MAQEISGNNFHSEVLQSNMPVLLDFSATWCGPCQKIAPLVEELAKDFSGRAKVFKIDVDNNQEIASQYGIMSVPTLMIIKGGEVVNKWIGYTPKATLSEALEATISS